MKVFQLSSIFLYPHIFTQASPGIPIPFPVLLSILNTLFISPPPTFPESLCFLSRGAAALMTHVLMALFSRVLFLSLFQHFDASVGSCCHSRTDVALRIPAGGREADLGFSRHFLAGLARERPQKLPAPTLEGFIPWGFDPAALREAGSSLRQRS